MGLGYSVIVPWKHALIAQFSSCPEVELKVMNMEK